MSAAARPRGQLAVVLAGHVDHGKSTVAGRLLADAGGLPDGRLEQLRDVCRRNAKPFEYAFLLDSLKDEQAQGVTIDVARVFFGTGVRDYMLLDAPGHVEFLRNMVTGAARASAALLVIDARDGVRENSRRHGYLLKLLGLSRGFVLINKMDLVGYSEQAFRAVCSKYAAFLRELDAPATEFIPVSGSEGDNLAARSGKMPWYGGPTVVEALDRLPPEAEDSDRPLRLPVQDVYRFSERGDGRRIVAGTIESGRLKPGDELVFYPSGKTSRATWVESAAGRAEAAAGEPVGLTLSEQVFVRRGQLAALRSERPPAVGRRFRVTLLWLGRRPLESGRDYWLKLGTARVKARLEQVVRAFDAATPAAASDRKSVERHEAGDCVLALDAPLACDLAADNPRTGRFVLVDEGVIGGGGLILEVLEDPGASLRERVIERNLHWQHGLLSRDERERRYGQRAMLLLITGEGAALRKAAAKRLEERLFRMNRAVYYLGIGSVLYGVDADIRGRHNHEEDMRRLAEVAHILLDSGMIVVATAAELTQADADLVRAALDDGRVRTIWVGSRATTDLRPDFLCDASDPNAAAQRMAAYLGSLRPA